MAYDDTFGTMVTTFAKNIFIKKTVTINTVMSSKIQNDHQRPNNHQSNH